MKINIKGKDIELKYSFRALMMYENIKNESFAPKNLTDVIIFMLCVIMSSDKKMQLTFDELIDAIDENPKMLEDFSTWLATEVAKQNLLAQDNEIVVDEEKKTL